jgi:hypothetical protein
MNTGGQKIYFFAFSTLSEGLTPILTIFLLEKSRKSAHPNGHTGRKDEQPRNGY